ncbi:FAD-dependent oxidoreductase [Paraburkholderia lacunae]|uniref:FAD-dependent oxidoreductase n=1 Tax=Paraburkholderia lacunae TaxID=2211104 RepID=UPI002448F40F|nr:FAD-dependent oxidoreductase [Paraburkholderia lacunae]
MTTTYPLHASFTRADQRFPRFADVVIAGAGIMGCAAAYYLARRGLSVVVHDKSRIAGQQSSRAWGFVRQRGREAAEVPLIAALLRRHDAAASQHAVKKFPLHSSRDS